MNVVNFEVTDEIKEHHLQQKGRQIYQDLFNSYEHVLP